MPDNIATPLSPDYEHNGATMRVVDKLVAGGVKVLEIGSDVWAIPAAELDAAKALIPNQPHFNYYLARDVRASQFYVGPTKVWVVHVGPGTARAPLAFMWAAVHKKSFETSVFSEPEQVTVYSLGNAKERTEFKDFYRYLYGGVHSETFMVDDSHNYEKKVGAFVDYSEGKFGSLVVGQKFTFSNQQGADSDIKSVANVLAEPYGGYIPNGQTRDGKFTWALAPGSRTRYGSSLPPSAHDTDLLKDLVVFCGPPCADYGEVYPDFSWFGAKATTLAARMRAVIQGTKGRVKGDAAKVEKALDDLEASGAVFYSFRTEGTRALDPIDFLPQTKRLIRSFGSIRPDGTDVTQASIERGLTDFYSGKWMLSAVNRSNVAEAIISTASKMTNATIRTSSLTEAHLSDGAGTANMTFGDLVPVVAGLLRGSATIDFQDGNFAAQEGFDLEGWNTLKDMRAPTEPDAEAEPGPAPEFGSADFANLFGEGVIARLALEKLFDKQEELLMLPLLSPQFMWTRYARDSVNTPATPDQISAVLDAGV